MRYGKVLEGKWTIEFRFNWCDNQYDVIVYECEKRVDKNKATERIIGSVWKDPRKSRRKPSWSATKMRGQESVSLSRDFGQMREAGLALLNEFTMSV
jgi:hypothetical protein